MKKLNLPYIKDYNNGMFFLLAGPCVVEGREITFQIAETLKELTDKYQIPFVFKASYRKANRSKASSFTGIGDKEGLAILQEIRQTLKVPVVTDIHSAPEAAMAASYDIDILQIPAFLCRQTDLLEAAAQTGKYVNIKKGQFLSPASMAFAAEKEFETAKDLKQAFKAGGEAAIEGAENTKGMIPKSGRAQWIGERVKDNLDGGAVLCAKVAKLFV